MAWLTATEALAALGVRPQTLYANVSRGQIQAKPDPKDSRRSLYHARDVERLAARRAKGRQAAAAVAAETMGWGEPVLASAVSTVAQGRLSYRGRDAADLSDTASLEEVAAWLWNASPTCFDRPALDARRRGITSPPCPPLPVLTKGEGGSTMLRSVNTQPAHTHAARTRAARAAMRRGAPVSESVGKSASESAFLAIASLASRGEPTHGRAASILHTEAATIVFTLVDAFLRDGGGRQRHGSTPVPIHKRFATAWGCRAGDAGAEAIRRALVLLADHELNASTFAARVTASTGASLAASVLAGLSALSGPLHGGAAASMHALITRARRIGAERALREWLAEGRPIAGFGHPLYPDGDLRALVILNSFTLTPALDALRVAAERILGERPNVDFALAALAATRRLPADAPFILFATARCVGWIAHALEQAASGRLIRPRARYIGPPPDSLLRRDDRS